MRTKATVIQEMLTETWERNWWVEPMNMLLDGWTSEQANQSLHKGIFPVTQIVNHTAFWEEVAARRLAGRPLGDLEKHFDDAHDGLAPSYMPRWPQAAENYRAQRAIVLAALEKLSDEDLTKLVPGDFALIWSAAGRAIHNTYHAGQLAMLHELVGHELSSLSEIPELPSIKTDTSAQLKEFLLDLVENIWNGTMWFHPVREVLADVSAQAAHRRPAENVHTVAEIVYHMKFWSEYVTRPLEGKSNKDMPREEQAGGPAKNPSGMPDWPTVRDEFFIQQKAFRHAVANLREADLFTPPKEGHPAIGPAYRYIYGIIVHDSYHLGQLVLIKEMLQAEGAT